MKERELREIAECAGCGKPFGHTQIPMFWRVKIEQHFVKIDKMRRQDGLTQMLGGHALLAQVMGPDEDMTQLLLQPVEVTLCHICALEPQVVASLAATKETVPAGSPQNCDGN